MADERVARFVSERLGVGFFPPYSAMGIERDGEIVGGVIFNCFQKPDVCVTVAGSGWTRQFFEAAGEYVYAMLGFDRMTITTEHEEIARYAERFGGKREGLKRHHFGRDRHGIMLGILREEFVYATKPMGLERAA